MKNKTTTNSKQHKENQLKKRRKPIQKKEAEERQKLRASQRITGQISPTKHLQKETSVSTEQQKHTQRRLKRLTLLLAQMPDRVLESDRESIGVPHRPTTITFSGQKNVHVFHVLCCHQF